jgi:hypothetical protein
MRDNPVTRLAHPMSRRPGSSLALALVLSALGLAACGSDEGGTIPQDDADALLATVDQVEASVDAGDCTTATTDATQLVTQINALPKEVGEETKAELRDAANNLAALTQDPTECEEPDEEQTTTTETGATGAFGFEEGG